MAVVKGKTVVHYTLELADTVVGQRYDSCITGIRLQDLMSMKESIQELLSIFPVNLLLKSILRSPPLPELLAFI